MKKRVLLAIDLDTPDSRAASYTVQLAARLKLSLVLLAVLPAKLKNGDPREISLSGLKEDQSLWLGKVRENCQQEGVNLEIFLAAGSFCNEVLAFAQAQSALQFLVLGWPEDKLRKNHSVCTAAALKNLHQYIGGEILLVKGQGKVTRLTDLTVI